VDSPSTFFNPQKTLLGRYVSDAPSIIAINTKSSLIEQAYPGLKPHFLTTVQVATQIPGILLEPFLLEKMGLRNLTILCAFLQVVGYAAMGGVPFIFTNQIATAVYIGNGLVGLTAGILLIPVGHVAATWMPDAERSTTLALCINAGNIGTGAGFFLSSLVAYKETVLRNYLNHISLVPLLLLCLVALFMEDAPVCSPRLVFCLGNTTLIPRLTLTFISVSRTTRNGS